jgi:hypothetical protein
MSFPSLIYASFENSNLSTLFIGTFYINIATSAVKQFYKVSTMSHFGQQCPVRHLHKYQIESPGIGDPPFFSGEMKGLLRTGRTEQVKRAAGHLRSLPALSSLQFMRCIPPALGHHMRRYSQGIISP